MGVIKQQEEGATPITPATGFWKFYPKADGFYFLEDNGVELKATNATHTGEVTGSVALTVQPTAISNKTLKSTLVGTEEVLINDAGTLKKTTVASIVTAAGSSTASGIIQSERTTDYTLTTTLTDINFDTTSVEKNDAVLDHDNTLRDRVYIKRNAHLSGSLNMEIKNTSSQDRTVTVRLRLNDTTVLSTITFEATKSSTTMVTRTLVLPPSGTTSFLSIQMSCNNVGVDLKAGTRLVLFNLD